MTIPASGPISLSQLKNEFGGNGSPKFSDYYRGGPFNSSWNETVGTTGALSLSMFRNLSKPYQPRPNEVKIYLLWNVGGIVGYYNPDLIINDPNVAAGSVTFTSLANYLSQTSTAIKFSLRGINDKIFPANTNANEYSVIIEGVVGYTIAIDYNGTIRMKPGGQYITPGTYEHIHTLKYVDNNGTTLYKDVKFVYDRYNR